MKALSIGLIVGVMAIAHQPAFTADELPQLDVNTSCRLATQAYSSNTVAQCLLQEQNARQKLLPQWSSFASNMRSECMRMMNAVAGTQSYVELLTCLEMARDSSKMKN